MRISLDLLSDSCAQSGDRPASSIERALDAFEHQRGSIDFMPVPLLITYDLKDSAFEDALLEYLDEHDAEMLAESSYLVVSDRPPKDFVSEICGLTDKKIVLYVLPLARGWSAFGPDAMTEALRAAFD
jgi:hypothetical protein